MHNPMVSQTARRSFSRIISQLDKATTNTKVIKIVEQARVFLKEHDIGWDAVAVRVNTGYVPISQRKKPRTATLTYRAATQAVGALNGANPLGYDGRALLQRAIQAHADWPTVRDTLELNITHMPVADLITVAQLLQLDEKFIKLFVNMPEPPKQAELPLDDDDDDDDELPPDLDKRITEILKKK